MSARDSTDDMIEIRGGSIRLGQLLKLAAIADDGADAKAMLVAGEVRVNGTVEDRRGRQLVDGDLVEVGGMRLRVAATDGLAPDEQWA